MTQQLTPEPAASDAPRPPRSDAARRCPANPILRPADVKPSRPDLEVVCLLNPGAFTFEGRTHLLIRVAERAVQTPGRISTPVFDPATPGGIASIEFSTADPKLDASDARVFAYDGVPYLTTLSHLRLARSDDGVNFTVDPAPTLLGEGPLEAFGLEDCRVSLIDGTYYLTYTAVSRAGVAVGMRSTRDWVTFRNHGLILPPHNKDVALFDQRIADGYYALHRPSGHGFGGHNIWIARSPDLHHWGDHRELLTVRAGHWDSERVGAGCAPIRTDAGWLAIYHGSGHPTRYCLGAVLLDLHDPTRVIARSDAPLMEPLADYETTGFFGHVVFTNGHVVTGDRVRLYYGAADEFVCMADLSITDILQSLGVG